MKLSIILAMAAASAAAPAHADSKPKPDKVSDPNLDRLRALKVFEVHRMVIDVPANTYSCYGPCPGSEKVIAEATRKATAKLQALTDVAVRAARQSTAKACPTKDVGANIAAINRLEVVAIGPSTDRQTPAEACERAARLANIATALKAR